MEPPPPPPANGGVAGSRGEVTGAGGWGLARGCSRGSCYHPDHGDHANWTGPPYLEEFILQRSNNCPENLFSIRRYNSATKEKGADIVSFDSLKCTTKLLSISSVDWFTIEHCKVT